MIRVWQQVRCMYCTFNHDLFSFHLLPKALIRNLKSFFQESCVLRSYGPWWYNLDSNIKVPITTQPLFISQDFIGNY